MWLFQDKSIWLKRWYNIRHFLRLRRGVFRELERNGGTRNDSVWNGNNHLNDRGSKRQNVNNKLVVNFYLYRESLRKSPSRSILFHCVPFVEPGNERSPKQRFLQSLLDQPGAQTPLLSIKV